MIEPIYTIRETAETLKLSRDEVNKMVHEGYFPGAFKAGRGKKTSPIHIPESALQAYLDSRPRVA